MTPHRFTPMTHVQSATVFCQIGPPVATPALLCTRCTPPYWSTVRRASCSTSSDRETSVRTASTSAPPERSSSSTLASAPSSMSATTTFMPSATQPSTTARPMPLAPPVTTATLPCSSFIAPSPMALMASGPPAPQQDPLEGVEVRRPVPQHLQEPRPVPVEELLVELIRKPFPEAGEAGSLDPLDDLGSRCQVVAVDLESHVLL